MRTLQATLGHLAEHGFQCLPIAQAHEAVFRGEYFLAYKFMIEKPEMNIVGLQIVLANLTQFQFYFPESLFLEKETPQIAFGFCGTTLIINGKGYQLRDVIEANENPPSAKEM